MAREGLNVPSPAWNTERNKDDHRAEVDAAVPTGCSEVLSVASYFCDRASWQSSFVFKALAPTSIQIN